MSKLSGQKRKNFTQQENKVLVELVRRHQRILLNKTSNAVTWANKEAEWVKVADEYNQRGTYYRDKDSLKLKWDFLKKQARKRYACIERNTRETGGVPEDIPEDSVLDDTIGLLGIGGTGPTNLYDDEEESTLTGNEDVPKEELWSPALVKQETMPIDFVEGPMPEQDPLQAPAMSSPNGLRCHPLPAAPARESATSKNIVRSFPRVKAEKQMSVRDQLAMAKIKYLQAETQLAKHKSNLVRLQCIELKRKLSNKD